MAAPVRMHTSKSHQRGRYLAATVLSWIVAVACTPGRVLVQAIHPIFLETNMRDAWTALLEGGGSSKDHEGAGQLIEAMLIDCHRRASDAWGRECDRALYLEAVLERIERDAAAAKLPAGAETDLAGEEIAVASQALPFSKFFLEYAVPRRPILLPLHPDAGGGRGDGGSGLTNIDDQEGIEQTRGISSDNVAGVTASNQDDVVSRPDYGEEEGRDSSSSFPSAPSPAGSTAPTSGTYDTNSSVLLDLIAACVPNRVDAAGTAEGPLRHCSEALLEVLVVPPYVAADFVQRVGGRDILAVDDYLEVERFASGWQSILRIRGRTTTPATACPSGANMILNVLFGSLEVIVYPEAELPYLQPSYGDAACPSENPSKGVIIDNIDADDDDNKEADNLTFHGLTGSSVLLHEDQRLPTEHEYGSVEDQEEGGGEGRRDSVEKQADVNFGSETEQGAVTLESEGERVRWEQEPMVVNSTRNWPHERRFCANVWPDGDGKYRGEKAEKEEWEGEGEGKRRKQLERQFSTRNARVVAAGGLLFVPSGSAVSWRANGYEHDRSSDGGGDDETIALRFCYVDASNFDSIKTQLPLYAAVEPGASALLKAFRSPVFETSMARTPSALSVMDFLAINGQSSVGSSTSSALSNNNALSSSAVSEDSGFDSSSGDTSGSMSLPTLSSVGLSFSSSSSSSVSSEGGRKEGRGRRGRKSFKEWQDDSRWNLKVLGLTLPTLEAPTVSNCGRTNCTVEWTCSFVKRGQDQTALGFNLSFVPANANASTGSNGGPGSGGGAEVGYMEVFVGSARLKSEHARDRELLSLGITEGKKHTVVVDANLQPDTPYRFSVSVVYGETAGPFSEQSKPAQTARVTPPLGVPVAPEATAGAHSVMLNFRQPHDDGGSAVSWYHVMMRPTGASVLRKWQAVGMTEAPAPREGVSVYKTEGANAVSLKVDHLVPGVAYQFSVCAQNDVGTSTWSAASEPMVALKASAGERAVPSLSGFHTGHSHLRLPNVTDAAISYVGERDPPPGEGFDPFEREVHGPTVVLDDRKWKVRVNGTSRHIDVWTCHFSPQSFQVTAEVVVAEPADASRELENGRFVRNRVVVVERGDIPMVHKVLTAQRAGALGVIIADDGQCGKGFNQLCVYGSDPPEGWAALDLPRPWLEVRIPVVLMLAEDAGWLRAEAGQAAEEAEAMAWSSLYDGWYSSSSTSSSAMGGGGLDWIGAVVST